MNKGITSFDKAWVPLVVAGAGVLGFYGITSPEQTSWIADAAPAALAMIAQAVLVFWKKNK
jgi:hypothetical protein